MRSYLYLVICLLGLSLASCTATSQTIGPMEEVAGKAYYMHTVEKGQTLYAICKLYKCDINEVVAANPGSDTSIKDGQILKIPADKSKINDNKVISQGNESFLSHTVEKKETLYAISKKYDVDINLIIAANPGCDKGLSKGQELRIPIKKSNKVETSVTQGEFEYPKHTVMAGETLYGISRSYSVSVDAIKMVNPGLGDALKEGQVILIPSRALPNNHSVEKPIETPKENKPLPIVGGGKKSEYNISLMLPFYSGVADSLLDDKDRMYRDVAINLYRGMQMASDSLKAMGLQADIYVNDVTDAASTAKRAIDKAETKNADIIFGPVYKEAIATVKTFSETTGSHIVIPVPQSNKTLLSCQNISKACPSDASQWEFMGRYVAQKHSMDNVILINSIDVDDIKQVQVFSDSYLATKGDSVRVVKSSSGSISALSGLLSKTKKNIIVMPTNDKKLINAMFDLIKSSDAIVYGYDEWETMDGISADNRNKYKIHFPKAIFLDYAAHSDQQWIETYRRKFKSEPTDFSALGYDMMMYYGQGLMQFGRDFPNHFSEIKAKGMVATGFDFIKTGDESGFENRFCVVLKTEDFAIIPEN
jgi:LysM repeat protein/ABC-type branched-subunit amino acid transport system substrate-binding protein